MKRFLVLAIVLGLLAPGIAKTLQNNQPTSADKDLSSPQLEDGAILYLELSKTVDAKKAKIGDQVTAQLLADVVSHGKIAIHRNSKLIGHVTEAQARTRENPVSRLGIVFDTVRMKHGVEITLHAEILAMQPPPEIQTDAPPMQGHRTLGPAASNQSDWPYSTRRASSRLNTLRQDVGASTDSPAKVQLDELNGLSLDSSRNGSGKVIVSFKQTVRLEGRTRLEVRVNNKGK
ncbi:MAG TPA: hypothetical protein VKH81_19810 [Candidatus Angelobacter sp.]|nr:hypothetical protein [Candidatus Angelobacter sp.]